MPNLIEEVMNMNKSQVDNGYSGSSNFNSGGSLITEAENAIRDSKAASNSRNVNEMLESDDEEVKRKGAHTAIALAKTESALEAVKQYTETTTGTAWGGRGGIDRHILDIVEAFYPNQVALDLVDVQQLNTTSGDIKVLKTTYADDAPNVGISANDYAFASTKTNAAWDTGFNPDFGAGYASEVVRMRATRDTAKKVYTTAINGRKNATDITVWTRASDGTFTQLTPGNSDSVVWDGATPKVTFNTARTSDADNIWLQYTVDTEKHPEFIRSMSTVLESIPVTVDQYPIKHSVSVAVAEIFNRQLGVDINDVSLQSVVTQLQVERDSRVINAITSNSTKAFTSDDGKDLDFFVRGNVSAGSSPQGSGGGNDFAASERFADFKSMLQLAGDLMRTQNGRGGVDFMLTGTQGASIVRSLRGFRPATVNYNSTGPYVLGTVDGIKVVADPQRIGKDKYYFGYKGTQMGNSGSVLAEFLPLIMTPPTTLDDLKTRQGLLTMYKNVVVNPKYYLAGSVKNYTT